MNKGLLIGVVVVIAGAIGFLMLQSNEKDMAMMQETAVEGEVMMKGEAMETAEVMEGNAMMEKDGEAMMSKGTYEQFDATKLAMAQTGTVVLFFKASWCPTCRALDADIKANLDAIPAGVTILEVDYDNSDDLRQKYAVTMQHTLVQVDANGALINKWSGGNTLAALTAKLK